MGSLFSSSKKKDKKKEAQQQQQVSKPKQLSEGEKARIKLQHQRDILRDKRKQIEVTQDTLDRDIKKYMAQNKREQAKSLFQRKMLYDKYLENILAKESTIAQTIQTVDQMQSDKEMAEIITSTNTVLKDIQNSMDFEKLQDAVMDLQEQKQQKDQMNQLYHQYQVDDQAEVDACFDQYQKQTVQQQPFAVVDNNKAQFVPLPIQQQQQQQQKQQNKQQQPVLDDRLAMLE